MTRRMHVEQNIFFISAASTPAALQRCDNRPQSFAFQGKDYTIESTPRFVRRARRENITFIRVALHALLVCKQQTERHIMFDAAV